MNVVGCYLGKPRIIVLQLWETLSCLQLPLFFLSREREKAAWWPEKQHPYFTFHYTDYFLAAQLNATCLTAALTPHGRIRPHLQHLSFFASPFPSIALLLTSCCFPLTFPSAVFLSLSIIELLQIVYQSHR